MRGPHKQPKKENSQCERKQKHTAGWCVSPVTPRTLLAATIVSRRITYFFFEFFVIVMPSIPRECYHRRMHDEQC